jgi:hypothetical protein
MSFAGDNGAKLAGEERQGKMTRNGTDTKPRTLDYAAAAAEIERRADQRAPGVLDMIEVVNQSLPRPEEWVPMNATSVTFATSATRRKGQ